MLHAAIYRAPPGSVIVAEAGDLDYALAGGNVCAVAQRNGVAAFVLDGVVRDLVEIRDLKFPVFAKGVVPKPGTKKLLGSLGESVTCGGVRVAPGDMIVGDEEGIGHHCLLGHRLGQHLAVAVVDAAPHGGDRGGLDQLGR